MHQGLRKNTSHSNRQYHNTFQPSPQTIPPAPAEQDEDIFSPGYVPPQPATATACAVTEDNGDLLDRIAWQITKHLVFIVIIACGMFLLMRAYALHISTSDHGSTLSEFIENTRYLDYEVYADFSPFGRKIYEASQNDSIKVDHDGKGDFVASVTCFNNYLSVHNHPQQDCPFSSNDLIYYSNLAAEGYETKCAIVISPDYIYELSAPNGWPHPVVADEYLTNLLEAPPLTVLNSGLLAFHYQDGVPTGGFVATDTLLERYAAQFDLVYSVTPIEEWSLSSALA